MIPDIFITLAGVLIEGNIFSSKVICLDALEFRTNMAALR